MINRMFICHKKLKLKKNSHVKKSNRNIPNTYVSVVFQVGTYSDCCSTTFYDVQKLTKKTVGAVVQSRFILELVNLKGIK